LQLREGTVTQYLHQVIAKIFPNNAFQQFDIVQIANSNRIQLIQDEGVKAIILKSYLYEASTTAVRDNKRTRGLISEIGKHVNVLLGREHKVDNDAIGKTLNSAAIKKELLDFYNELRDSKAIEI
jgi:hypothetical protein